MGVSRSSNQSKESDRSPGNSKAFAECLSNLFEELRLALQWDRPSILLAVQKSELRRKKAMDLLEGKLSGLAQQCLQIRITDDQPDIRQTILSLPEGERARTVFFVTGIGYGGGEQDRDTYRALNMQREFFVENRIRLVFWLSESEAYYLPRYAPDFWAFRHAVVEFAPERGEAKNALPAGALIWVDQEGGEPPGDRILYHEQVLSQTARDDASVMVRLESLSALAYLNWWAGDLGAATDKARAGLDLAEKVGHPGLEAVFLNSLAVLEYESREKEKALELIVKANEKEKDAGLLMNLGIVTHALGKNRDALSTVKKALGMEPGKPRLWLIRGYLYTAMGKYEEALASFEKAQNLSPDTADYRYAAAVCYFKAGRLPKAKEQIEHAHRLASPGPYQRACEEAMYGNRGNAIRFLRQALDEKKMSLAAVRRDVNLHLIFAPLQVASLL